MEWARASRRQIRLSVYIDSAQSLLCMGLVGGHVFCHFLRTGAVTGGDVLLVYWTLTLPAIGHGLSALAQQLPMLQNILMRLMEPLSAPEEAAGNIPAAWVAEQSGAASIVVTNGAVVAAGHECCGTSIWRSDQASTSPSSAHPVLGSRRC